MSVAIRPYVLALWAIALLVPVSSVGLAQGEETMKTAEQLLKRAPRTKRPALPPSALPLKFIQGERIALIGNSTAERMNLFGNFETLLHLRYPDQRLVVRN